MKIIDYLKSLPKGEIVGKRALAYFKRIGFIWDYSRFGYIEGLRISGAKEKDTPYREQVDLEISSTAKCKKAEILENAMYGRWRQTTATCKKTAQELHSILTPSRSFRFAGMTFGLRYFDGCFKPYLVKEKDNDQKETVTRHLAFPGGVI